jgi:hypothetical protein
LAPGYKAVGARVNAMRHFVVTVSLLALLAGSAQAAGTVRNMVRPADAVGLSPGDDIQSAVDPRKGGNGIMIVQQNRGYRHMPRNNSIHDNDVTMGGGEGAVAGWFAEYKPNAFSKANNVFDKNRYHVYAPDGALWAPNEWTDFAAWQATGQDAHSTVDSDAAPTRVHAK